MVEGAALVAAICGRGAPDSRTKFGPQVLRRGGLIEALRKRGVRAQWQGAVWEDSEAVTQRQSVTGFCRQLAGITDALVNSDRFFTVIGGDHSCAAGTWAGAARGLASAGSLGLIWIDAHMDGHTPETTPSGAYHGMPLAALLGRGDPALTAIGGFGPAVRPHNLCLVGVRSYEPGERALLDGFGVRVFYMDEIARRGLGKVFREAVEIATSGTAGFGVTLDLDALDPADATAVGSPELGGLHAHELMAHLPAIFSEASSVGLEIAEFNPALDVAGRTENLITEIMATCLIAKENSHAVRSSS